MEIFSQKVDNYIHTINAGYLVLGKYFYNVAKTKGINRVPDGDVAELAELMESIKSEYIKVSADQNLQAEQRDIIYMLTSR